MTQGPHMPAGLRCARSSEGAGEPLPGTAVDRVDTWLLIELDAPWGKKGLEDTPLPDGLREHVLIAAASRPGIRAQLIKAEDTGGPSAFVVRAGDYVERLRVGALAELNDVDLVAWIDGHSPVGAEVIRGPMVLVCAHTKRDACCAEFGLPLYRELRERLGGIVWQSSHLGGHRFAATLVTLPDGYQYGRLREDDAGMIARSVEQGQLGAFDKLRGSTRLAPAAQAADLAARQVLGLTGLDDIRILSTTAIPEGQRILMLAAGRVVSARVRTRQGAAAYVASCGVTEASYATIQEVIDLDGPP